MTKKQEACSSSDDLPCLQYKDRVPEKPRKTHGEKILHSGGELA